MKKGVYSTLESVAYHSYSRGKRSRRSSRGYYSGWSPLYFSAKKTKYDELHSLIGSAVGEIKREFFSLPEHSRDHLFTKYGIEYGANAESYARNTFNNWRSGSTLLSGQTMERLIQLVPPYLSAQKRYSFLEIIVNAHKKNASNTRSKLIRINTESPHIGVAEIKDVLPTLEVKDPLAHLPENVMRAANWLYDDDITVARAMLSQAESKYNDLIKASATRDLQLIYEAISAGQIKSANYRVVMPSGALEIQIYTPKKSLWQTLFG